MKQTKVQKSARGQECTLRIPHVCNWDNSTTILAHVGKHGTAKRNHDSEAVFACSDCHDAIDFRNKTFLSDNKAEQELLHKDRLSIIDQALAKMKKMS